MDFRTLIDLPKGERPLSHADRLLLLGSCFADAIGERLAKSGFRCAVNPFGTLYNPLSVAQGLERVLSGTPFTADDLQWFAGEGWGSWMHHSRFSRPEAQEAVEAMNSSLSAAHDLMLPHQGVSPVILITLGTAWVYRLADDASAVGRVVANCHKQPERLFVRRRLSVDDLLAVWCPLLERLQREVPGVRLIFTVSPIRHLRDGAHENQLSKATLLLFVDELRKRVGSPALTYFPAYEILLDELRDYRFYADDMVHPSSPAVGYIWERFGDTFFSPATRRLIAEWESVQKALAHRPFRPDSDEYRRFICQTLLKIEHIQKECPNFDAAKEIASLKPSL